MGHEDTCYAACHYARRIGAVDLEEDLHSDHRVSGHMEATHEVALLLCVSPDFTEVDVDL